MTSWEPGNESPADGVTVADLEPSGPAPRGRRNVWIGVSVAVVVTVVLTTAIIAASSSSPSPPDGSDAIALLRSAPASTSASGTARSAGTVSMTVAGETRTLMHMKGTTDFRTRSSSLLITAGPVTSKARLIGGTEYFAQTLVPLPRGAKWVKITRADAGETGAAPSTESQDPSAGLQFMKAVSGNPKLVGSETLDGTHVAHYKFTLDLVPLLDKLAKVTDKLGASQFAKAMQKLESVADLRHVPGEAWLDGDGRVRRFDYRIEISTEGQTVKELIDLRFSKFGAPVTITAPPASEVIPFSQVPDLFKQIQNGATPSSGAAS
jgi:hypothetical protein